MMRKIQDYMDDDHDRLNGLFGTFRAVKGLDSGKAVELLHEFKKGLMRHMVWEEEVLMPLIRERLGLGDGGPLGEILEDHLRLRELLQSIHDRILRQDRATEDLERRLVESLAAHDEREGATLYAMLDHAVNEIERVGVYRKMKEVPPEKYNRCCD
jgi:hemerythrin superfamily protein